MRQWLFGRLSRADRVALIATGLLGLVLAVELLWPHPLERGTNASTPPDQAEAVEQRPSNPPEAFTSFSTIYQRPLFREDRRPFEPEEMPPEILPELGSILSEPVPSLSGIAFQLDAVVITPRVRLAFLSVVGGEARKIREGEVIDEWILTSVQPSSVILSRGEEMQIIELRPAEAGER